MLLLFFAFLSGIVMIVPVLNRYREGLVSRLSRRFGSTLQTGTGFSGGFVTGLALRIIWSPCAGPILAAIATLAALGKITSTVIASDRLYNLINLHGKTENHLLHLDFLTPGTQVYAFTFG